MNKEALRAVISDIEAGRKPVFDDKLFPCFSAEALRGQKHFEAGYLEVLAACVGKKDLPTFKRALKAIDQEEYAWLGVKVVYDSSCAVTNVDNAVTQKFGKQGSADGEPLVFFCNEAGEVVSSCEPSPRDLFQMKDITRGPSMHNDQFEGLTWVSVPLFNRIKVWLLGASDVASEVAALASHVGFDIGVVDYDKSYLNVRRFPQAQRIVLENANFDGLKNIDANKHDYVCVLTRGHMFDPQGCLWAIKHQVHYVGMMGCAEKNDTVHRLVLAKANEEAWQKVRRPIGLKFGAKTPAELAIAIVAELVDVRYQEHYSEEARAKHEKHLRP